MLFTDFISVSSWMLSSQDENIFYDFSGLFESNQCKLQPQIYRKFWKGRPSAALWFSVCQWRSIHNVTKGTLIFIWYHSILLPVLISWQYGLRSFQTGGTKLERFLHKNQHTQRKLLNFENWCKGEVSKSAKKWLSKSIFYVKNHLNLSQFFFHWIIPI